MEQLTRLDAAQRRNRALLEDLSLRDGLPAIEAKPELAPPSESQAEAIDFILNNPERNVVIRGPAGTGKSHVLKHLMERVPVACTATTARAALLVGGCTVDRVFNFKRNEWRIRSYERLTQIMDQLPMRIAIDESSMIGSSMGTLIHGIAKQFGKQVIMFGDWAQAAPVKDGWGMDSVLFREANSCVLRENHRQTDQLYLAALNDLRSGQMTDRVREVFQPRCAPLDQAHEHAIIGQATNRLTYELNSRRLAAMSIDLPTAQLHSDLRDDRPEYLRKNYPRDEAECQRLLDEVRFAAGDTFKVGARVLLTMNHPLGDYVNGDAGQLVEIYLDDGKPVSEMKAASPWDPPIDSDQVFSLEVRLDRTDKTVLVQRTKLEQKSPLGEPDWTARGFPIKLGWGGTLHWLQGTTLDHLWVNMQSITHMVGDSKHGLAYVAFSRTRTLEGLQIGNWDERAAYCAEAVRPFV